MSDMEHRVLSDHVEIVGAYFGGHAKAENRKGDRVDRRLKEHQTGKRRVIVVMREREGRTLPFVFRSEDEALPTIQERLSDSSTDYADVASCWDGPHARFEARPINHSVAFSDDGACTNQAESYFSRLRRGEIGRHHHVSGRQFGAYACEMAWREDARRQLNGTLYALVAAAAMAHPVSREWKGYWQRRP